MGGLSSPSKSRLVFTWKCGESKVGKFMSKNQRVIKRSEKVVYAIHRSHDARGQGCKHRSENASINSKIIAGTVQLLTTQLYLDQSFRYPQRKLHLPTLLLLPVLSTVFQGGVETVNWHPVAAQRQEGHET